MQTQTQTQIQTPIYVTVRKHKIITWVAPLLSYIRALMWQLTMSALWRSNLGLTFDSSLASGLILGAPKVRMHGTVLSG
jgi:hypothetical protein